MANNKTALGLLDILNCCFQLQTRTVAMHLIKQHINNLCCRTIAEKLPKRLFVIGNPIALNEFDEVALGIAAQCGNTEVFVLR